MTLQGLFAPYYGSNAIEQMQLSVNLLRDLRALTDSMPSIKLIMEPLKRKGMIHPDDFIAHLSGMGLGTWENLQQWMNAVQQSGFDAKGYFDLLAPPFPKITTTPISVPELWRNIRVSGFPIDPMKIDIGEDAAYRTVSDGDLWKIIRWNNSDEYSYINDARNCNDFARRIFLAELSKHGFGDLAIGYLIGTFHWTHKPKGGHLVNWAYTIDGNLWVFEPQSDQMYWQYGGEMHWPGLDRIEPVKMGI